MKFQKNQIIYFGLAIHLLAAFFSVGHHQADELFQVYEFAGFKLGLNTLDELPWEFREQMRSGIQPFIVYGITKVFHFISISNPFSIACFIRIGMALFSFAVIVGLLNLLEKEITSQKLKRWLWYAGLLFWCLPYFHARFSSENFSATLFTFGLLLVLKNTEKAKTHFYFLLAGIVMGLAFLSRFQIIFMIMGLFAWLFLIRKMAGLSLLICLAGIFMSLGIGLLLDHWLYNEWILSWWNYLDLNLFQDKASLFGKQPFYFYLEETFLQLIPPFSLLIIFCVVAFWFRFKRHVLTWITLPFIILHFFVAHKELRFLFPVLNFLPFILILYLQSERNSTNKFLLFFKRSFFLKFSVFVNIVALLIFTFKPANDTSHSLKKIYELVQGHAPVLFYEGNNPYNKNASLNYFRNKNIVLTDLKADTTDLKNKEVFYYSEKFNEGKVILKNKRTFTRIYSNFPAWFSYLNFNGWLDRSTTFAIYRQN